jgi:hypothetical protein
LPNLTPQTQPTKTDDLIRSFRKDLRKYAAACLKIRQKDASLKYLSFNNAQNIVHDLLGEQRRKTGRVRAVILKARQEGVSTYVAARFFRRLNLYPATSAMVVADSLERAGVLYDIYARYYENLPQELAPARRALARRRHLAFAHDSEITVRPSSDSEAGRAMTIHLLHASELAFWGPNVADTWMSLQQAVPHTNSEIIVESTAKGAGGFFHELWEQAEAGESGWMPIFLPWWIHEEYEMPCSQEMRELIERAPDDFEKQALTDGLPYMGKHYTLSLDKLAWRRAIIVERFGGDRERLGRDATRGFQQEFPATAEEAFLVSGACFFDEDSLRRMTRLAGEPEQRGMLRLDGSVVRLVPSDRGFVRVYKRPNQKGHYVIGADTAQGRLVAARRGQDEASEERGGRDYSSAVVYNTVDSEVVAEIHGRIAPEVFAEQLRLLGNFYACGGENGEARQVALIAVERSHSSGQTVLRLLRETYQYPRLYWQREFNKLTKKVGRSLGWDTTTVTRMPMLDQLAGMIRKGEILIPSRDIMRELVTFVVYPDGKPMAEEGCHDDRVIALAIALEMVKEHRHGYGGPIEAPEAIDTPTGW